MDSKDTAMNEYRKWVHDNIQTASHIITLVFFMYFEKRGKKTVNTNSHIMMVKD